MAEKLELHVPEKRDEGFCIRSSSNNYSMILIRRLGCIRYKLIEKASAFLGLKQWWRDRNLSQDHACFYYLESNPAIKISHVQKGISVFAAT